MAAVITANNPAARDSVAPPPALKEDGSNYKWRMFYDGGERIADADTTTELLEIFIPGYQELDSNAQFWARVSLGKRVQTTARVVILANATQEELEALQGWEKTLLEWDEEGDPYGWHDGTQEPKSVTPYAQVEETDIPQVPDMWRAELPLVLLEVNYAPTSVIAPPLSSYGDRKFVKNIIWIDVLEEQGFLDSLSRIGFITFGTPAAAERFSADAIPDEE